MASAIRCAVFALLDGVTTVVRGVEQLGREALDHGVLRSLAATGGLDQPPDGQRLPDRSGAHLDGHLVGRAADAARANLDSLGLHVARGQLREHLTIGLDLRARLLDAIERTVHDTCSAMDFLPSYHQIEFMNLVRTMSPYLASGIISRFSAEWRRDIARSV